MTNEQKLAEILLDCGIDISEPGRQNTPKRVIKYWKEQQSNENEDFEWTTFESDTDEMVVVKDIQFSSSCEHHLLPFFGKAHVAYIPKGKIIGLSKLPRAVKLFSKGFQTQEHLTQNIAQAIKEHLQCDSVAVVMEAEHTCMSCRGIRSIGSTTQTSTLLGAFRDEKETRQEFYNLIQ